MTSLHSLGTGAKLAAYASVLAATFAAAAGLAVAVGPIDTSSGSHDDLQGAAGHGMGGGRPHVPGISIDSDGFRIVPAATSLTADVATTYSFRIVDSDGDTVTDFDVTHERRLHLIVVSRNFVDYHHLHPTQDIDGVWTADVPALPAGSYRVFADTRPTGADGITLGTDLAVGNGVHDTDATIAIPAGGTTVTIEGYEVGLTGSPNVGESTLTFSVVRNGEPIVADPYLGASGHLVALRAGDLAFLHVHPLGDATPQEPGIRFAAQFPTPGTYRLFLDISMDGTVRTAAFTVEVPEMNDQPDQHNNDNNHDTDQSNDPHEAGH
ncbi:MAG: FixH family protein [Actinomycetota bacterium]|nr:FixH family protein [Actinomycetota bacterium]